MSGGSRENPDGLQVLWSLWEGPGAAVLCPTDCREPAAARTDSGIAREGEIGVAGANYSRPSPAATHLGSPRNHSGVVWLEKQRLPALYLGREQGLAGFKGLLRVGKHTAQPRQDLEQFTPCPHTWAVCCRCFRCCTCILDLQGSAEVEGEGG